MPSLAEKAALRASVSLRDRLAACLADEAYLISTGSPDVRHDANASAWAAGLLRSWTACVAQADAWMHRLTLNAVVAAAGESATDTDLQYVVRSEIVPAEIAVPEV